MKTAYRKSAQPLIPPYDQNGALQLIVASGTTFIMFHFVRIVMLIMGKEKQDVFNAMFPNIGLSNLETYRHKAWTILTYGWVHQGFFDWFTNMIWLYCFASVLQTLAGYRQVIPLFVYAILVGGGVYVGSQTLGSELFHPGNTYYLGSQAGIFALGFAALTLAPAYRLHLAPSFSVPLVLVLAIFVVLNFVVYIPDGQLNAVALCAGGGITGFIFGYLLKAGYSPAGWIYSLFDKVQTMATPNEGELAEKKSRKRIEILRTMYEPKKGISQERIDEILDKINDNGYHALSREEKDILFRAGKD